MWATAPIQFACDILVVTAFELYARALRAAEEQVLERVAAALLFEKFLEIPVLLLERDVPVPCVSARVRA